MSVLIDTKIINETFQILAETYPKEAKKFLNKEKMKLRKRLIKSAAVKVKVGKKSEFYGEPKKRYHACMKPGKVWQSEDGMMVRVYNSSFQAHLIEYGHRIIAKDGSEHGFQAGKFVFRDEEIAFQGEFIKDVEDFINETLRSIL